MGAAVSPLLLGAVDEEGEGGDGLKVHRSGHSTATSGALQRRKGQKSGSVLSSSLPLSSGPGSSPEPEPPPTSPLSSVGNQVGSADGVGDDDKASVCGAVVEIRLFVVVRGAVDAWPRVTVM